MKNLYRKGKIHPSPTPPPTISDHLALLPATILTLTAALSPQDREVLAYLISCSNTSTNFYGQRKNTHKSTSGGGGGGGSAGGGGGEDHDPLFQCNCFRCYMSYWVKWDTSPNRQLIHEIIDAYEEGLFLKNKSVKAKKEKKRRDHHREKNFGERSARVDELGELESVEESCSGEVEIGCGGDDGEVGLEKGSVRKLVSFIGEKIWGVWNR